MSKRKRIFQQLKENKGFTLLEMMVSFTLLLILMSVAITTILPSVKTFHHVIQVSRAQSVSNLLVDKISGELSSAIGTVTVKGSEIEYADKKGNKVRMKVNENGRLVLHYTEEGSDWYFTDNVYMGSKIPSDGLKFEKVTPKEGASNILVKVTLKVANESNRYEYERGIIVDCYDAKNMQ